jgi:hypothetical protein
MRVTGRADEDFFTYWGKSSTVDGEVNSTLFVGVHKQQAYRGVI